MIPVKLCLMWAILLLLLEIVPITGFFNHQLLHYSSLPSATRPKYHKVVSIPIDTEERALVGRTYKDYKYPTKSKINRRLYKNDKYEIIQAELLNYKKIYGNMLVPSTFVIPHSSDWPEYSHGFKLGITVCRIRGGLCLTEHRGDLIKIGFDFKSQMKYKYDFVKSLLLHYKKINNHMLVPATFVIPFNDETWPDVMWNTKLGFIAHNIRRGKSYLDRKDELEALGFDYECQFKYGYDLVKIAILKYKELNGDMLVPSRYSIPAESVNYPREVWGMNLGTVVHDIRRKYSYLEKREELTALGFAYVVRKKFDYEIVKIAVYKYRELYHGTVKFPPVYTIPKNDLWYPEETWGLPLGSYVKRIKKGDLWPEKYSELFGL